MFPEANRILGKFIRRAFWMNDPASVEFRLFFMEMITEMRNLSGRNFNADISLGDLKRTITNITEKYPALKNISINTIFKTLNTMDSFARAGDLFSIASAVSASFLSIGTLFIGPLPFMLLKVFAPGRLKCGVIMGLGGLIGMELYDVNPLAVIQVKRKIPVVSILSGSLSIVMIISAMILSGASFLIRLSSFACAVLFFLIFIVSLGQRAVTRNKGDIRESASIPDIFNFSQEDENTLFSNFKLDREEARFLFSLYYELAESGIDAAADPMINANKRIWLDRWKNGVEDELSSNLATGRDVLKEVINGPMMKLSKIKISLIFMECALYKPFFPLPGLTDLIIPGGSIPLKNLNELALLMNVNFSPASVRTTYQSAVNSLNAVNIIKQIAQNLLSPPLSAIPPITVIQSDAGIVKTSSSVNIAGAGSIPGIKGIDQNFYIIGGGILLEKEMFPLLCRISAGSSYSFLCQAARLETVFRIILQKEPDYSSMLEDLLIHQKELRSIFIKTYNGRDAERAGLRESLHFLEISIKKTGDLIRYLNKKGAASINS